MKEMGEKFYLLNEEPECTNVIFWYVPERLRPRQCPQYGTRDWHEELGIVTAKLKGRMMNKGSIMISYQPLGMYPNFFRSIVSNQVGKEIIRATITISFLTVPLKPAVVRRSEILQIRLFAFSLEFERRVLKAKQIILSQFSTTP